MAGVKVINGVMTGGVIERGDNWSGSRGRVMVGGGVIYGGVYFTGE